ncbi:unnamed protein product [Ostreobium quekettii]|uniref:CCR4-NOT transcription complex subunit 1 CAF1-binding domain-containing protein n=1 Tax=Ostreobium quekettii TaxID=121088 RepID=A0A8S1IP36_9CHLO|nr:unnamed protein product [Ostreobium quekettii]
MAGEGANERRGLADALLRAGCGLEPALRLISDPVVDLEPAIARALVMASNRCEGEGADPREGTDAGLADQPVWRPAQFADAIKSERPRLDWGRVAASLDIDGFEGLGQGAFAGLMEAFRRACPGGFPLEAVLGLVWRHPKAQLAFLRHAVAAPSELFEFRPDQGVFPVGVLEARRAAAGGGSCAWVSLDLLETLYMLAKGGHELEVRQILDYLVRHCKEVLLVALDRMGVPECAIFQEAYRNLIEHFLRQTECPSDCNPEEVCSTVRDMILECATGVQEASTGLGEAPQAPNCGVVGPAGGCLNEASMPDAPCQSTDSARSSIVTCSSMQGMSMETSLTELSEMWTGLERSASSASSTMGSSDMDDNKRVKAAVETGDDGQDGSELGDDFELNVAIPPCLNLGHAELKKGKSRRVGTGRARGAGAGGLGSVALSSDRCLMNKTLREACLPPNVLPPQHIQTLLANILDDICGCVSLADRIRRDVNGEDMAWLADSLLAKCIVRSEHPHSGCLALVNALPQMRECVLVSVYHYIYAFLHSSTLASDSGDRHLLRRLGSWLGHLTLARNTPIRLRDLDLKAVLDEAWREDTLPIVLPFLLAVLIPATGSLIFTAENPWIGAVLVELAEVHTNGHPCVRPDIERIMDIFDADLQSFVRRHSSYQGHVRGAPVTGSSFHQSPSWLVYQTAALQPTYSVAQHQAIQVHGVQGSSLSGLSTRASVPSSSVLRSTWAHHRWGEASSQNLVTRGKPAWHQTGLNVDMTGGFYTDKWLRPESVHGFRVTEKPRPGLHNSNGNPDWGGVCGAKKICGCRAPGAGQQIGKYWNGLGCRSNSGPTNCLDLDRRLAAVRSRGGVAGPSNLVANAVGPESGECMAGCKAVDNSWEGEVGPKHQPKEDDWSDVHKARERGSDASSSSDFEDADLAVDAQDCSDMQTTSKCRKGHSGGKSRGNNVAGMGGHLTSVQWHQSAHCRCWKQGGGQKTKCRCRGQVCIPQATHKNKSQDNAGCFNRVGMRPVVTVPRKSSKSRGRRIEDKGCWSGSRQVTGGWKSGAPGGRVVSLRQGAFGVPEAGVSSEAAHKTLGSEPVHRSRNLPSGPMDGGRGNVRNSDLGGHGRGNQEKGAHGTLLSPGRIHRVEVANRKLQGSVPAKPTRRNGDGKVLSKHLSEPAANGRPRTCTPAATAKSADAVADKRRHKKRNKKTAGGGRQRHQRAPKVDTHVIST